MKKLVKESLKENILNELLKVGKNTYKVIKTNQGTIYVGEEGILGKNDVHIPWEVIDKIKDIQ